MATAGTHSTGFVFSLGRGGGRVNSITKRWVRGSLLVTILMCLVAEAVFLY